MDYQEEDEEGYLEYNLSDYIDHAILMHKDSHFAGSFDIMLDYYNAGGKGVNPDFDIERIQYLADIERRTGRNLAAELLTIPEMEKVAKSRETYKKLRGLFEEKQTGSAIPTLIASLILSEEDYPQEEIKAIVALKGAIVPSLLQLLQSSDFHDPLNPGYGLAPMLAAKCLGEIGDKRALISLFEMIGEGDFFEEDTLLEALRAIGAPAKEFLLRVVKAKPYNFDNERAAIALIAFKDDPEVARACFQLIKDPAIQKIIPYANFLVLACEGLKGLPEEAEFRSFAESESTQKHLKQDSKSVLSSWK